jgi:malate dehydrogenase (oxaloacetate-decarboxylating)
VRASTITDEMCIAAATALADMAEEKGLSSNYILPTMDEWEVFPREAAAVATKAVEQGLARKEVTYEEELKNAGEIIRRSRSLTETMMKDGFIAPCDQ